MKEVVLIFAVLLTLATTLEGIPILGSNRRVSHLERFVKAKEQEQAVVKLPKHNLNRGQLKKMDWLRYVDKA